MDYTELAKQYGAVDQPTKPVDYTALANQYGAITTTTIPKPSSGIEQTSPDVAGAIEQTSPEFAGATPEPTTTKPEQSITYEQLYNDPKLFGEISSYMKARHNEPQKEGESNQQYVDRFLGNMRFIDFNTVGGVNELNWIRNANKSDAVIAAKAHDIYKNTADFYESGGASSVGAITDAAKAIFLDPLSYIGFGTGAVAKTIAARKALQTGINKALTYTGAMALEGTVGAGQAVVGERIGQETDIAMGREVREISPLTVGLSAALSAFGGAAEVYGVTRGKIVSTKDQLKEIIDSKPKMPASPTAPLNKVETIVADELTNNMDNLVSQYMKMEGKEVLEAVDPATALTDSKIQKDVSAAAVRVAAKIIVDDPIFQLKEGQKISDAIANVFKNIDQVNDVALERAIREAGLTPDEFAKANLTTVSEAASVMQQYSAVSKMFNRLGQIDPAFEKRAAELFGKQDEMTSSFGYIGQAMSRLERESKAWVVSGIGTTVRNILGTGTGLTFRAASSLFEGTLFTLGRNLKAAATGQTTNFVKDFGSVFKESFNELSYLSRAGLSAEVTDELLKHNPSIRNHLLSALQETGDKDVTRAARLFNSLNVAQDAYFRRAIFNASVEKKLGQMGLDMYQLIGEGKHIPADVLSSATDEALKATFSYMPKPAKKGQRTLEAGAETMAHHFVKVFENVPGGSLLVTFPRFMSNAMAFQYRYSVFGAASGASDLFAGAIKNYKNAGSGDALVLKGQQNLSRGIVGTAALYGAYKYRQENADSPWYAYKTDTGMEIDLRPVFPIGPYLAVGEFLAKLESGDPVKAGEMIQTIIGMKLPAGTQNTILDQIVSAASSERDADKLNISIGKLLGDFTSRFTAPWPFKTATEFYGLFDRGEAIARDPNVIAGDDKIMEAAVNRFQRNIPGWKQELPEAVPRLREETPVQDATFFRSLLGVTAKAPQNFAEKEITRLNIDPYKLFGQSTGDKEYDRAFIEISNPYVLKTIERVTKDPRYQKLSPSEQRIALTNSVQLMLSTTRDMTMAKFASKDLDRIFKIKFDKMTTDQRRAINEAYAKDHAGATLEQTKDYRSVPRYEGTVLSPLQFAVGGIVKGITKAVGKMLDSEVDNIVTKSIKVAEDAAPDVIKKADEALTLTPPPSAIDQTSEMLVKESAPVPKTIEQPFMVVKGKKYNTDDVKAAEIQAIDMFKSSGMDDESIKKAKINDPDWYEDQVREQLYEAGASLYNPKQSTVTSAPIEGTTEGKRAKTLVEVDIKSGNLNDIVSSYNPENRSNAVNNIRDYRESTFPYLFDDPVIKGLKDSDLVVGVLQGDWRALKGSEIDPFNKKQMKEFATMAQQYQKKLDLLREEYKDAPPKRLYHGSKEWAEQPTDKADKGFTDPQKREGVGQVELGLKSISFTSDPAMNISKAGFGGKNPERYLYTEMPRAEYEFKRVNMTPKEYDERDFNSIAKVFSGSDNVIRPLSLPRSSYKETEDALIEVDKFKPGASTSAGEKLYHGREKMGSLIEKNVDLMRLENDTIGTIKFLRERAKDATEAEQGRIAYALYGQIKDLLNIYLKQAGGPDARGLGQNYLANIERMAGTYNDTGLKFAGQADDKSLLMSQSRGGLDVRKLTTNLAKYFDEIGSKQKADNLRQLSEALDVISSPTVAAGSENVKPKIKAVNDVRELTRKFAKGGLASRK